MIWLSVLYVLVGFVVAVWVRRLADAPGLFVVVLWPLALFVALAALLDHAIDEVNGRLGD